MKTEILINVAKTGQNKSKMVLGDSNLGHKGLEWREHTLSYTFVCDLTKDLSLFELC